MLRSVTLHPLVQHAAVRASGGSSGSLSGRIGEHSYWNPFGATGTPSTVGIGPELNLDTIGMSWLVMAIIIALALFVRGQIAVDTARGTQNVLEMIFEFIDNTVRDVLGNDRAASLGPLAVALFLYILVANYIGLIPLPMHWWHSPTSDFNTTLALSLLVIVLVHTLSIRARGIGSYVRHYFQPTPLLVVINLPEELAKLITLSMRLFGNIFAGEVLVLVFASLLTGIMTVILPLGQAFGLVLGLFVGAVQAFIFTILTVSYIGIATAHDEH